MYSASTTAQTEGTKSCDPSILIHVAAVSGYAIVSFLCRAQKMHLPDALSAFAAARSPGIYHQPYLDDLWLTLGAGKGAMAGPKPPPWAMDLSLVPAHGAFSLPAMPAKKQVRSKTENPTSWIPDHKP